ncbi:MAG TPA: bifunctional DNA primase/polymerase, partial [Salinarimonas sp.]|nr:bifunctional DNA primase/polymerase [Salinarimonas sp.]
MNSAILEAALQYAALGWRVLPVRSRSKVPALRAWQKNATSAAEEVRKLFARRNSINIGIATGRASDLLLLDIDPDTGGFESLERLEGEHAPLPPSCRQKTGRGGLHILFSWPLSSEKEPLDLRNTAGRIAPGVDIRGEGGQFVIAPSVHETGKRYEWIDGLDPFRSAVAPPPSWLVGLALAAMKRAPAQPSRCGPDKSPGASGLGLGLGLISQGGRNDTLFSYAGKLRKKGMGEPEILAALRTTNQESCVPPLEERELIEIAQKICKYPAGLPEEAFAANRKGRLRRAASPPVPSPPPSAPEPPPAGSEMAPRRFAAELITLWLRGAEGPGSPELVWREADKAYSNRWSRMVSRAEIKESRTREVLEWLLDSALELEDLPERKDPISLAISVWTRWAPAAFIEVLGGLPDRSSVAGLVSAEEAHLGAAIYSLLARSIRVSSTNEEIPVHTSILQEAADCRAVGWVRVGRYGVFVRRPEQPSEPRIALRYDHIVQVGERWLREL